MLKLKKVLATIGKTQANLARELALSPATIAQIINHELWPKQPVREELEEQIKTFLQECGATAATVATAFETEGAMPTTSKSEEDELMLLRKQSLTPDAKRAFGLARDPFGDIYSAEEVFLTTDSRYVREALRQTSRHGGFVAVCGESGAGKSTLRKDLIEWLALNHAQTIVIEPYVLGMEDNDVKGKTLKSASIADAILAAVAPGQSVKRSADARFRQVHEALRESHRSGNRHVLIIEEAHSLPIPTLKHLKRFYELEDGFSKLLGIVLIGQTELERKLDERDPRVREVVQRCELIKLYPLDNELGNYLSHRLALSGKQLSDLMDEDAVQALRKKLTGSNHSVLYPLAINNVLTAALNEAAAIGMPVLTAELIAEV